MVNATNLAATSTNAAAENNHRFPGQYFDQETSLAQNYFRDYEKDIGRYVQSDPVGLRGGINRWEYAESRSQTISDSAGLAIAFPIRPPILIPLPPIIWVPILICTVTQCWDFLLRNWTCEAKCTMVDFNSPCGCNGAAWCFGAASGPNEQLACLEAKRAATQTAPPGCYCRHCRCLNCSK